MRKEIPARVKTCCPTERYLVETVSLKLYLSIQIRLVVKNTVNYFQDHQLRINSTIDILSGHIEKIKMKVENITLNELLKKDIHFQIPIYQRTYDWSREQIRQLYEDVIRVGSSNQNVADSHPIQQEQYHFIGAITCVALEESIHDNVKRFQIIDGQQRITSVILLLRALRDLCGERTKFKEGAIDKTLFNTDEDANGKHYHKIKLFDEDDILFRDIMKNGNVVSSGNGNIEKNFEYFKKQLEKDDPNHIWYGIKSLNIVLIELKKEDNPQAIFESMNSTGLDLTPTDMIQNYMLMGGTLEWQERMYNQYWHPMEQKLNNIKDNEFDEFLRYYLIMKLGMFVSMKQVYPKFKEYMKENNNGMNSEIKTISKYSEYYADIIDPQNRISKIQKELRNIQMQGTSVANSLLLKILEDENSSVINTKDAKDILLLLDSYLVRSYVCSTIKGANKDLPKLISKIKPKDYVDSVKNLLVNSAKYPSDARFMDSLGLIHLYRNNPLCKYMLGRLEQGRDKRVLDLDSLEIEHIMPQNPEKWKGDLGDRWEDVHEKYVNTIGNLTLTESNQELSNLKFSDKRDVYSKSQIHITKKLSEYKTWEEKAIKDRAEFLAKEAVRLWPYPKGCNQSTSEDNSLEEEYLEKTNIPDLWYALKQNIKETFPEMRFHMTSVYGVFTLSTMNKKTNICEIEALNNKIHLIYNTKIKYGIIKPSSFIEDVSQKGHLGPGELRSTIRYEDDIERTVEMIRALYDSKKKW